MRTRNQDGQGCILTLCDRFVTKSVEVGMRESDMKEGGSMQNQMHSGLTKNDMIQQGFVTM